MTVVIKANTTVMVAILSCLSKNLGVTKPLAYTSSSLQRSDQRLHLDKAYLFVNIIT